MSSYAVSGQHICNVVESVSQNIEAWTSKANAGLQLAIPFIKSVDIYDIEDKELLLLEDAVGVKQQKQYRNAAYTKITQTVQTDVVLVNNESNSNDYTVYVANNSDRESLNNQILAHLSRYSQKGELPIVVIADGARSIRKNLQNLLGMSLIFILDWYHLSEKIWQFMSQIAVNKLEKEIHSPLLVGLLWEGKVQDALCYLEHSIVSKNSAKKQELVDYLIKHEHEIIDYERRKKAGKKIGSGAVEKANDIIVAHRQKKKGMAWSKDGSKALSILKALEVNQKWASFWQQAA